MHDQTGHPHQPARRPAHRPAHRPAAPANRRPGRRRVAVEPLEQRALFAVGSPVNLGIEPNVNVTRLLENQHSGSVTVNRQDPGNIYVTSVSDLRGTGPLDDTDLDNDREIDPLPGFDKSETTRGVLSQTSFDAGQSFIGGGLVEDAVSPSAAFDEFGNLFLTYFVRRIQFIDTPGFPDDPDGGFVFFDDSLVEVALSTDGGLSFQLIQSFEAGVLENDFVFFDDEINTTTVASAQPSIATGAGSVWVSFERDGQVVASGSRVRGLGSVEGFINPQTAFRSEGGKYSDVAIGPDGEVMVTYQVQRDDPDQIPLEDQDQLIGRVLIGTGGFFTTGDEEGPAEIFVNIDPDGLGIESFGRRFKVTDTTVGQFDPIPAQSDRTIDAEPGLAWDRSGGPFNGRVYIVYTDEPVNETGSDTDILLRFSDDNGQTWSTQRKVTDEDFTEASEFFPRIAVDQTTGNVAVTWYDTRRGAGLTPLPLQEAQYWGTVGVPTIDEAGIAFAENIQISQGTSNAARSRNVLEFGEYTGLDFHNNVFYPVWADNSNSTGDNPGGGVNAGLNLATLDIYTTRVFVTPATPQVPERAPVGPGSPLTPQFIGRDTINKGKAYKFQVRYQSESGIDVASLGDDDLVVTGPNGYDLPADFTKAKRARRGTVVTATYQAAAPGGKFDLGDNGLYSILLQEGAVRDLAGTTSDAGLLDQFLVSSTAPPQSPPLLPASAPLQAADADENDDKLRAIGL